MISNICSKPEVNLSHSTPHTLRRSYATYLHNNDESIFKIKHQLGHEKLETTERYIKIDGSSLKNMKNPLDFFDQSNK